MLEVEYDFGGVQEEEFIREFRILYPDASIGGELEPFGNRSIDASELQDLNRDLPSVQYTVDLSGFTRSPDLQYQSLASFSTYTDGAETRLWLPEPLCLNYVRAYGEP